MENAVYQICIPDTLEFTSFIDKLMQKRNLFTNVPRAAEWE
jgi:hypothetical protein